MLEHAIDFDTALEVFEDLYMLEADSTRPEFGVFHKKATGALQSGLVITVVYTDRGNVRRIISARRARKHEQEHYYQSP